MHPIGGAVDTFLPQRGHRCRDGGRFDPESIQRAWERFIQNGTVSNAVRGIVAASWERSQGYRIPIERDEAPLVPEDEMVRRYSEHAELVAAARPANCLGFSISQALPQPSTRRAWHLQWQLDGK